MHGLTRQPPEVPGAGAALLIDPAFAVLPEMVAKSHDRLCTVTRTVERGTAVNAHLR